MSGPVVIVGPTASGKTALAVDLARRDATLELVSIDALAVYRGLDVGTAKPRGDEREVAPWHLIDLVEASVDFSIAAFVEAAAPVLSGIEARGHRAVLVGGSGLYLRAVLDGLSPPGRYPAVAAELEREAGEPGGSAALHARLAELDPTAASRMEPSNTRRIVRALEVTLGAGRPFSSFGPGLSTYPDTDAVLIGLDLERSDLDRRIGLRLEAQLAAGFVEEVAALIESGVTRSRTAAQAIGYRELAEVVAGRMTLEEARGEIVRRTRSFARRQQAWFRRDPRITWVDVNSADLTGVVASLAAAGRGDTTAV